MEADIIVGIIVALGWLAVTVTFIRVGIGFRRIGQKAKATADAQEAHLDALTANDDANGALEVLILPENCSYRTSWPNKPLRKVVITFCDQYGNPMVHPAGAPFTVLGPASDQHPPRHEEARSDAG